MEVLMYYLMIKEIEQTGLKYLCKRKQNLYDSKDHIKYKGSGILWNRILRAHPEYTITTTILGLYSSKELIKQGLYYSELYNIVDSNDWANLILESGNGGNTANTDNYKIGMKKRKSSPCKGYRTIHNIDTNEVRRIKEGSILPDGFIYGNIKGRGYGPKGKTTVYHNGERKIYVTEGESPPSGFVPGFPCQGSTKGRKGYHNPITKEKLYIKEGQTPPVGFISGLPPTPGKKVQTTEKMYDSIQECMNDLNLTRYEIGKNIKTKGWKYL